MTLKYALRSITDKKQGICERRVNRNLHHTTHVSNFLRMYYFLYEIKKQIISHCRNTSKLHLT